MVAKDDDDPVLVGHIVFYGVLCLVVVAAILIVAGIAYLFYRKCRKQSNKPVSDSSDEAERVDGKSASAPPDMKGISLVGIEAVKKEPEPVESTDAKPEPKEPENEEEKDNMDKADQKVEESSAFPRSESPEMTVETMPHLAPVPNV